MTTALSEGPGANTSRDGCDSRGDRRTPENAAARLLFTGGRRLRGLHRVTHGCSFPGIVGTSPCRSQASVGRVKPVSPERKLCKVFEPHHQTRLEEASLSSS